MRTPRQRVLDMLDAIARIERHAGRGRAALDSDEVFEGFVLRQLQILGEAAYQMPQDVRDAHVEVPWLEVAGMRHILVHGYFEVRRDVVWAVVERDVPRLKPQLERMLASLGEPNPPRA